MKYIKSVSLPYILVYILL